MWSESKNGLYGDGRPRPSVERSSTLSFKRAERRKRKCREQGYVLLSLLLIVALLTIAAASAVSSLAFNIRRDREEEMIHRGVEYSRAIRRYTKKTGHYPLTLDALENTDGLRFLRKRYQDPITGKDFKLLHMTDLQRVGVGGLGPSAAIPPNAANGNSANVAPGRTQPAQTQFAQPMSAAQPAPDSAAPDQNTSANSATSSANSPVATAEQPNADSQPLSGGVIVGVASASSHETIREFNHKNHYKDWLFFYDPAYDRGFEIKGPTQLTMPTFSTPLQQPGTPGTAQLVAPGTVTHLTSPQPAAQ
jgi:type II secretory pathway pseudopilin PulG